MLGVLVLSRYACQDRTEHRLLIWRRIDTDYILAAYTGSKCRKQQNQYMTQ
jgi:hypothetical protein